MSGDNYERQRLDALEDGRFLTVAERVTRMENRLEKLEARINYLFGALAVLTVIAQIVGPAITAAVVGS